MSISYVAQSGYGSASSTKVTLSTPTGTQVGDMLIAFVFTSWYITSGNGWTTPTGWTKIFDVYYGGGEEIQGAAFFKAAESGDLSGSTDFEYDEGNNNIMCGSMLAFRGAATDELDVTFDPNLGTGHIDAHASAGNPTNRPITIESAGAACIVSHWNNSVSIGNSGAPSGYVKASHNGVGYAINVVAYKLGLSPGSHEPGAWTHDGAQDAYNTMYCTIALKEPSSGGSVRASRGLSSSYALGF